ncbi:MAG: hypothetical protein GPOALKHO_000834 [Sodalis sp.]|nr:MAG: hypothetical protein GPOALKHO_000834 [Sodalis sp.]
MFNGIGYQGDNISPHLAKSFVITVFDSDSPIGPGNIPADVRMLPQGAGSGHDHLQTGMV